MLAPNKNKMTGLFRLSFISLPITIGIARLTGKTKCKLMYLVKIYYFNREYILEDETIDTTIDVDVDEL